MAERIEMHNFQLEVLDPGPDEFYQQVDDLRATLGTPNNPQLFPPYYLKRALIVNGGQIINIQEGDETIGAVWLFPTRNEDQYLARVDFVDGKMVDKDSLRQKLEVVADKQVQIYEPSGDNKQEAVTTVYFEGNGLLIRDATTLDADQIRQLQKEIWGSKDDSLYPVDLHSPEFAAACAGSFVAVRDGKIVGFLFGFYRWYDKELFSGDLGQYYQPVGVESQIAGVRPEYQSQDIGLLLKRAQEQKALNESLGIITWTYDPLLSRNAWFNLGKLGALIVKHMPDYYPGFDNDLNRVPASRFTAMLLLDTERVEQRMSDNERNKIGSFDSTVPVAYQTGSTQLNLDAPTIAIKIPGNWGEIQRDIERAQALRTETDPIFGAYVNRGYVIHGVEKGEDGEYYLIASKPEDVAGLI